MIQTIHGYNTGINLHWVPRCIFSTGTYLTKSSNHVNQTLYIVLQIEGHVPQGVEVQVLSSALACTTCSPRIENRVPIDVFFWCMVFNLCL